MKWHCLHLPNNFWVFELISTTFGRGIGIIPSLRSYACNEKICIERRACKSFYQEKGSIFVIRETLNSVIEERSGMERLDHRQFLFAYFPSFIWEWFRWEYKQSLSTNPRASLAVKHLLHLLSQQNPASNHGQTVIHTKDGWIGRENTEGHPWIVSQASVPELGKFMCKFHC